MNEDLATVLRGLDPAERLTTIAALGEQTTTVDLAIQFELTGKSVSGRSTTWSNRAAGLASRR